VAGDVKDRCARIEECYEFMLAYAAQGLRDDRASQSGTQLRDFLARCDEALTGLSGSFRQLVESQHREPAAPYDEFLTVLERDARDAQAAIRLVLAQPAISSQTIDNLNASIHLRALLTDVFLIDEILVEGGSSA
jgi:hypothetical protein